MKQFCKQMQQNKMLKTWDRVCIHIKGAIGSGIAWSVALSWMMNSKMHGSALDHVYLLLYSASMHLSTVDGRMLNQHFKTNLSNKCNKKGKKKMREVQDFQHKFV